jgi:hypothetical protein
MLPDIAGNVEAILFIVPCRNLEILLDNQELNWASLLQSDRRKGFSGVSDVVTACYIRYPYIGGSRVSSGSIVSDYGLEDRGSILERASASRPALGPTQPPVQSVPG